MVRVLRPQEACVECLQWSHVAKAKEASPITISMQLRRSFQAIVLIAASGIVTAAQGASAVAAVSGAVHQHRIYEIFDDNKRQFHDRFRDHAMRIMARYGFNIVAMWEAKGEDRTEFVYLLEWPDEATMKDRWANFMADKEWAEIKRVTAARYGRLVGDIEDRTLRVTEYSPRRVLAN